MGLLRHVRDPTPSLPLTCAHIRVTHKNDVGARVKGGCLGTSSSHWVALRCIIRRLGDAQVF